MSPLTDEHPRIISSLSQPGYRRWLAIGCAAMVQGVLVLPFFLTIGMALDAMEQPPTVVVDVVAVADPEPPQPAEVPAPAAEAPLAMPEPQAPSTSKPEAKPEPPPELKPDLRLEPKPEPKPKPRPKPDAKSEAAPVATHDTPQTAAHTPALSTSGVPVGPASGTDADHFEPPHGYAGYLNNPPPPYPDLARRRGWEGLVVLTVSVGIDGYPDSVRVKTSSGYTILDDRALETVKTWRFSPARRGGRAVAATVDVPLRFRLTR